MGFRVPECLRKLSNKCDNRSRSVAFEKNLKICVETTQYSSLLAPLIKEDSWRLGSSLLPSQDEIHLHSRTTPNVKPCGLRCQSLACLFCSVMQQASTLLLRHSTCLSRCDCFASTFPVTKVVGLICVPYDAPELHFGDHLRFCKYSSRTLNCLKWMYHAHDDPKATSYSPPSILSNKV